MSTSGIEKTTVIGQSGQPQEVRFFSDQALQASMLNALNAVTEKSALLNLEQNSTGFNAAIATKLDGHWSIVLAAKRDGWGWAGGTSVKFSWK